MLCCTPAHIVSRVCNRLGVCRIAQTVGTRAPQHVPRLVSGRGPLDKHFGVVTSERQPCLRWQIRMEKLDGFTRTSEAWMFEPVVEKTDTQVSAMILKQEPAASCHKNAGAQ